MRTFTGIQALRGIAALSVVCGHAITTRQGMGIPGRSAMDMLGVLQSGVDIFFVISGFIIASAATEAGAEQGRQGAFDFAARRLGRIYPLYWLVLAAAVISTYWINIFPAAPPDALDHIGIDHILALSNPNYFVAPAWSLCFEMYFYAATTVVILVAPRNVALLLIAALGLMLAVSLMTPLKLGLYGSPLTLEFVFGVGIAILVRLGLHPSQPLIAAMLSFLLFAIGGYVASSGHGIEGWQRVSTYGLGAAVWVYAVAAAELNGAVFSRWLQYLGAISYSLYLSHHLLLTLLSKYEPAWLPGPAQILIWIALSVALAAIVNRFFERPALRLMSLFRGTRPNLNASRLFWFERFINLNLHSFTGGPVMKRPDIDNR